MRWTERQRAMLQAMGLRLWLPAAEGAGAGAGAGADDAMPMPGPASAAQPPGAVAGAGQAARHATDPAADSPADSAADLAADSAAPPASARAQAIARMDWAALEASVAGCQACGLCQGRRHTVFGVGHRQAQVMVVGEAPGEQEDRQGEPFVGPAGALLDRMLASIGLARDGDDPARSVFIANTLKCRPPGNRNPSPEELLQCVPLLQRQVALVQPRLILAMGRFAVQALLGSDEPLGRLRGRLHRWQGVPVVVSYHPAYLLRQPAEKAKSWADLCLAAAQLDLPAAGTPSAAGAAGAPRAPG